MMHRLLLLLLFVPALACGSAEDAPADDAHSDGTVDGSTDVGRPDDISDDLASDADRVDDDAGEEGGEDAEVREVSEEDSAVSDAEDVPAVDPTPCGPDLTCAPGDVCIIECLCCGVDTGNPADARAAYSCATPDPACADTPAACIAEIEGCYANGPFLCESPCA